MTDEIKTYNDYKIKLLRLVRGGSSCLAKVRSSLKTLENIIDQNIEYNKILKSDEIMKVKLINDVFKTEDRNLCDIILNLFEIDEEIPEYEMLSDIIYVGDLRYRSNLVNKKNNIYYIFDLYNLDGFDPCISMEDLYNLCEDELSFNKIKIIIREKLCRDLNNDELCYILVKSKEYRDYINNEYNNLIENIIENEGYMDSDMECYNILYNYLGKIPNKFEVKLLMKMCV